MSLTTFMFAQQLAAAQQVQDASDELAAPSYDETLQKLIQHGNFAYAEWKARVAPVLALFGGGLTLRKRSEREQSTEAKQISDGLAAATRLMNIARAVLQQASRKGLEGAAELYDQVPAPSDIDSYRTAGWELMLVQEVFKDVDLTALGFPPRTPPTSRRSPRTSGSTAPSRSGRRSASPSARGGCMRRSSRWPS